MSCASSSCDYLCALNQKLSDAISKNMPGVATHCIHRIDFHLCNTAMPAWFYLEFLDNVAKFKAKFPALR